MDKVAHKVVIVGVAARFAGASDVDAVAALLDGRGAAIGLHDPAALRASGRTSVPVPGPDGLCAAGLLEAADAFDPLPLGMSPQEGEALTVRERLVLTAAWQAVEDSGLGLGALTEGRTAVYVGAMRPPSSEAAGGESAVGRMLAGQGFMLANRVSAALGFSGGSETIDAAHASGLVALHRARQALAAGECDHAVVAAVAHDFAFWEQAPPGVLSPGGRCRVFDAAADGVAPSEGVAAVLLTTADRAEALGLLPHAVVLGSAVGHSAGTAPLGQSSRVSQAAVLREAWAAAGIRGADLSYVEAHGTGTVAGDPVEMAALDEALSADGADGARCLVGSAKAALGHAEAAAGLAGLVKALLVLRGRRVPGQPGLERLNPLLTGLRAVAVAMESHVLPDDGPLRVGVTALGIGGTCAHVVLESGTAGVPDSGKTAGRLPFLLSAPDAQTLEQAREAWRSGPAGMPFADLCATLALGRKALPARFGVLAESVEEALAAPVVPGEPWTPRGLVFTTADSLETGLTLMRAGAVAGPLTAAGEGVWPLLAASGMADAATVEAVRDGTAKAAALRLYRPQRPVLDPVSGVVIGPWRFADLVAGLEPETAAHLRGRWQALRGDLDEAALLAPWRAALERLGGNTGRPFERLWDMVLADVLAAHLIRWGLPLGGGADEGAFRVLRLLLDGGADRLDLAAALDGDATAQARLDRALAGLAEPPRDGADLPEISDVAAWIAAVRQTTVAEGLWVTTAVDPMETLLAAWRGGAALDWSPVFAGMAVRRRHLPLTPLRQSVPVVAEAVERAATTEDDADVRAWLRRVVAEEAGTDPATITDDAGLNDACGVDSIANTAIVKRLGADLGQRLPATLLFAHPTIAKLSAYLRQAMPKEVAAVAGSGAVAPVGAPILPARPERHGGGLREPVAIVGLAGRFPGAGDKEAFWDLLLNGVEAVREVPAGRWDWARWAGERGDGTGRHYTRFGAFVEGADQFDPLFFNIAPAAAGRMDPQQRLFLEVAWAATEDAGHTRASLPRDTGVYVGASTQTYALIAAQAGRDGAAVVADCDPSDIANRVSFQLDLHGPSMTVDTACSASLTAVHLAVRALRAGEVGAAIVGGVNLTLHPARIAQFCEKGMLTDEAHCRPFGDGPGGFVDGEGAVAMLLKPLSRARADGDHVYGVILGTAVNSGGRSSGYTVPDPKAQAELVRTALADAGVSARSLSYVECHGTGTRLGDPIEVAGLTEAFRADTPDSGFCAIGSLKANIGHLIAAAGLAGLAKTALQLERATLAPSINADPANPRIDFAATPFAVNRTARPWEKPILARGGTLVDLPRRAGVSSFGSGGSNAHVVVEEAPVFPALPDDPARRAPQVVVLSARTPDRLAAMVARLRAWLETAGAGVPLPDIAHTLRVGREAMTERLAAVVATRADLIAVLDTWSEGGMISGTARRDAEAPAVPVSADAEALCRLWVQGAAVDWELLYPARSFRRVPLPAYPFDRVRCWLPEAEAEAAPVVPAKQEPAGDLLFAPTWRPTDLPDGAASAEPAQVLVIGAGPLAEALVRRHAGARLLAPDAVLPEDAFARIYLLAAVAPPPVEPCATDAVEDATAGGPLALLSVVRTLAARGADWPHLVVVTSDAAAVNGLAPANPLMAALHGFAKSLAKEDPELRVSCVDVAWEDVAADADGLAARIAAEPADERGDEVALRGPARLRRGLARLASPPSEAPVPYRQGGVYLIVGGAGGIGAAFSAHLAASHGARFVWLGRRAADDGIEKRLQAVRDAGGDALYVQGDAADDAVLARAVALAEERFDGLHGVIHSAIVLRDGTVARMGDDDFRAAYDVKARTAAALIRVLRGRQLDFLAFFSSALSLAGFGGQANYAAGCAVKDALAHHLAARVSWPVRTINWGYWSAVGIVATPEYERRLAAQGLLPMPPDAGMEAVARVLGGPAVQTAAMNAAGWLLDALRLETDRAARPVAARPPMGAAVARAALSPDQELAGRWQSGRAALEALLPGLVLGAFNRLGWPRQAGPAGTVEDLRAGLGIHDRHRREFAALLRIMAKRDWVRVDKAERVEVMPSALEAKGLPPDVLKALIRRYPEVDGYATLSRICLEAFPEVLTGRRAPTDVMFPEGSMALVEPIYRGNPEADWCNTRATATAVGCVQALLESLPPDATVSILEVGAGTGGTTSAVLPALKPYGDRLRYVYTDVSRAFTDHGKRRFGADYPFVEYALFDAERPPEAQGFVSGSFDLVLATNVLHATRDMRRTLRHVKALLAGNGLLIANEITSATGFTTVTFGLLDGWWLFEDVPDRLPDAPLLGVPSWRRILGELGYRDITVLPGLAVDGGVAGDQHVIVAASDGVVDEAIVAAPAAVVAPETPAVVAAPASGVGDALGAVCGAVAQALGLAPDAVDLDAPFRDYGVDSITGVGVIRAVNKALGCRLGVTDLFDHPSVRALARAAEGAGAAAPVPVQASAPALPKPVFTVATEPPPELTRQICEALAVVLSVRAEDVAPGEDVRDMGLDRAMAASAARHLAGMAEVAVVADDFFIHGTAKALALALDGGGGTADADAPPALAFLRQVARGAASAADIEAFLETVA